jgi:hypothetical protein
MAIKTFRNWVENKELQLSSSRDLILGVLKDKLGITDEETILDTPLSGIKDAVWTELMHTGGIKSANPNVMQTIQNRSGTVRELIDQMASTENQAGF